MLAEGVGDGGVKTAGKMMMINAEEGGMCYGGVRCEQGHM